MPESRNKFWAGLAMLLLFLGLLVGTVVLFSYLSPTGPAGTPPLFGGSTFDLIFLWLTLLFVGLAILNRLFRMLSRD